MAFERVEEARRRMKEEGVDVALVCPSTDLFYLTGIRDRLMERLSCVVITGEDIVFIAPGFEVGNVPESIRSEITCRGWTDGEDPFAILSGYLPQGDRKAMICGVAPSWILLGAQNLRPSWNWINADAIIQEMRLHKDEREYAALKDAQARSNRALTRLLEQGVCGLTELEAAKRLNDLSAEEDLDNQGLPIVASGPNTALPHHHPGSRTIEKGDVVLFDFGGSDHATGYQTDTTRTFAVKTMPAQLPEIYDIVMRANQAAFEASKPGVPCQEVDAAARRVIESAGYGEFFTHRLGHGLGLSIHEEPYMTAGNNRLIEAGFVFSDEPGIYMPGRFGVRIEDLLYIHPEGAERLTVLSHELTIID